MANLPSGYTQVEYIESTGTQYIDTGISVPCNSEKIIVEFAPMEDTASNDNPLTGHAAPAWSWDANLAFVLNERLWTANTGYGLAVIERGTFYKFEYTSSYCMVNDANSQELSARTYTDGYNNTLCYASTKYGKHKIKSYKLYNGSTLVRDLVPCINASGEAGMYDLVGNQFYGNAGTGVFKYKLGDKGLYVGVPTFEKVNLPDGYTQVEYIQSNGEQYINTGLKPNNKYRVIMDFQLTSVSGWACLFGSSDTVGNVNSYALWYTGAAFAYYFGTNSNTTFPTTIDNFGEHHFESNGNTATIDGSTVTVTNATFSGSQPLYLFAVNYGGTAQHFASGKWKPCKIYNENGTLVRHYIPCINPSGMVGLYDLVDGVFDGNAGTGTFTAGGTQKSVARKVKQMYVGVKQSIPTGYTQVEYIQSSGTQYLDTGFTPNQDSRVVMDCDLAGDVDGYACLFASRQTGGAKQTFAIYHSDSTGKPYDQYNATTIQTGDSNLLGRHTIDKNKNITYVDGVAVNTFTYASFTGSCDLRLFADKQPNTDVKHFAIGKIYSCKIYDNGTMVRNFMPCTNIVGVAGLYDLVEGKFYANAGTDTFTAGPVAISLARFVLKGYIGVAGIARPFWDTNSGGGGEESKAPLSYYGTVTGLKTARYQLAATTIGDYALFGGGGSPSALTDVDAYNTSLTRSTPSAALNYACINLAATSVGNHALFGGGYGSLVYMVVNPFDKSLTRKSFINLSTRKQRLAATTIGGYALFGGGITSTSNSGISAVVDVINTSLSISSATALKTARQYLPATSVGNYALFGGGMTSSSSSTSAVVDAYNTVLTRSNPTEFSVGRYDVAGTTVGKYALFGGGYGSSGTSAVVDAYDESLTRTNPAGLSLARCKLQATTVGGFAIFAGGSANGMGSDAAVDVYDESLTRTSGTSLSEGRYSLAAATVGNYALFGGGFSELGVVSNVDAYTII